MESISSRRDSGAVTAALREDLPVMQEVLGNRQGSLHADIEAAIDPTGSGLLRHWVAVAVWEREDGSLDAELIHDERSSDLETQGFLHDGLWKSVHPT